MSEIFAWMSNSTTAVKRFWPKAVEITNKRPTIPNVMSFFNLQWNPIPFCVNAHIVYMYICYFSFDVVSICTSWSKLSDWIRQQRQPRMEFIPFVRLKFPNNISFANQRLTSIFIDATHIRRKSHYPASLVGSAGNFFVCMRGCLSEFSHQFFFGIVAFLFQSNSTHSLYAKTQQDQFVYHIL